MAMLGVARRGRDFARCARHRLHDAVLPPMLFCRADGQFLSSGSALAPLRLCGFILMLPFTLMDTGRLMRKDDADDVAPRRLASMMMRLRCFIKQCLRAHFARKRPHFEDAAALLASMGMGRVGGTPRRELPSILRGAR